MISELKKEDYHEYITLINNFRECNISKDEFINILEKIKINGNIYIYKIDNKIVGTITLMLEQKFIHNGAIYGYIEDLFVAETFRNLGIGSKLISFVIEKAKNIEKCRIIKLNSNHQLINYYKKKNFEKYGYTMYLKIN